MSSSLRAASGSSPLLKTTVVSGATRIGATTTATGGPIELRFSSPPHEVFISGMKASTSTTTTRAARVLACSILGRWQKGLPTLVKLLETEDDEQVLYPCALALGQFPAETLENSPWFRTVFPDPRNSEETNKPGRIQIVQAALRALENFNGNRTSGVLELPLRNPNTRSPSKRPSTPLLLQHQPHGSSSASSFSILQRVVQFSFSHGDPWVRQWGWQSVALASWHNKEFTTMGFEADLHLLGGFLLGGHEFWQTAK
eukprot:GSA25T00013044001.1